MASSRVTVTIVGDADSVRRAFAVAGNSGEKFGRRMHGVAVRTEKSSGRIRRAFGKLDKKSLFSGFAGGAGFMATTAAFSGFASIIESSVEGAASLQRSGHAIDQVFGKAGGTVKKFAEKDAAKLGISAETAQTAAVKFGLLFENIGVGKKDAAAMAINMLRLAGAMGIIRGVDPATMIDKLPLAMAGNTRGLKAMGIVATPKLIKAEEKRLGVGDDPRGKALAIYAISIKNLGLREQQAAKHTKDLRTQQQKLGAQWANTKDKIGKLAIPALSWLDTQLLGILNDFDEIKLAYKNLSTWTGPLNAPSHIKTSDLMKAVRSGATTEKKLKDALTIGVITRAQYEQAETYIHTHVHVDGKVVAETVTKHQHRKGKGNAPQSRGRIPGVRTGMA